MAALIHSHVPIRLLSVIHGPAYGGAHNQAVRLRAPLERRGIETVVVLPEEAGAAADKMRRDGLEVIQTPLHRLRATTSLRVQGRFLSELRADQQRLSDLIAERAIDVVQVHGATNPQGALAARRNGAAVVWQIFDTRAPLPLRRIAMPLVVRLADAMTVWGRELARVHPGAERMRERLTIVYPPVDSRDFAADEAVRESSRAELGIPPGGKVVGSVGVLNPQKGHEYMIRAAELVRRRRDDVHFRVLGGPSPAHAAYERELLEEVAARGLSDYFHFVDPGGRVADLLQAFDVFAMTSVPRSEGMPTVILEAMMSEKPVVATDVGAVTELVEPGATGMVVEPLRPELVAAEVDRLLDDPDLRLRIASAGHARAQREFSLEGLADLHAMAYRQAIEYRQRRLSGS